MAQLSLEAHAKINWRLAVTGRRADGYHELYGLMQSISLSDTVTLYEAPRDLCRMEPAWPGADDTGRDNLAFQAWQLLKQRLDLHHCLRIKIAKRIPLGGGLAGGSADAAAVLKGANQLFALGLTLEELQQIGLELGVDVPFCLQGGLALAAGVGERLTALPAPPPLALLLANAGGAVATPRVFQQYRQLAAPFADLAAEQAACARLARALAAGDVGGVEAALKNDLEAPALVLHPELGALKQLLRAQGLSPLLSGSGGTVFALCADEAAAVQARAALSGQTAWLALAWTQTPLL